MLNIYEGYKLKLIGEYLFYLFVIQFEYIL